MQISALARRENAAIRSPDIEINARWMDLAIIAKFPASRLRRKQAFRHRFAFTRRNAERFVTNNGATSRNFPNDCLAFSRRLAKLTRYFLRLWIVNPLAGVVRPN